MYIILVCLWVWLVSVYMCGLDTVKVFHVCLRGVPNLTIKINKILFSIVHVHKCMCCTTLIGSTL